MWARARIHARRFTGTCGIFANVNYIEIVYKKPYRFTGVCGIFIYVPVRIACTFAVKIRGRPRDFYSSAFPMYVVVLSLRELRIHVPL